MTNGEATECRAPDGGVCQRATPSIEQQRCSPDCFTTGSMKSVSMLRSSTPLLASPSWPSTTPNSVALSRVLVTATTPRPTRNTPIDFFLLVSFPPTTPMKQLLSSNTPRKNLACGVFSSVGSYCATHPATKVTELRDGSMVSVLTACTTTTRFGRSVQSSMFPRRSTQPALVSAVVFRPPTTSPTTSETLQQGPKLYCAHCCLAE